MSDLLKNCLGIRWVAGSGAGTALFDPVLGTRHAAGSDAKALADVAVELAPQHGRVHVLSPDVAALHTGHGNVMPQSLHGGRGRAGGGEELGGARALNFHHRRAAIQASTATLNHLA